MEDHQDDREKEFPSNGRLCIKLKIHKSEEAAADPHDDQLSPGEESLLSLIAQGGVRDQPQHESTNTINTPGSDKNVAGGKEVRRVCRFCNKSFGSGKALGGHMRVHVQATHGKASGGGGGGLMKPQPQPQLQLQRHVINNSSSVAAAGGMMSPVCSICGKTFLSMKSLFGHMRCHPERDWRGIQPPPTPTPPHPPTKNSSSSTLSDACGRRNIDFGEQIDSTNTTNAVAAAAEDAEAMPLHPNPNPNPKRPVAVDLARRFRGWSRTDKRGRKIGGTLTGTSGSSDPSESTGGATAVSASSWSGAAGSGSESEEQIPDAVYNLMLLAQGRPFSSYQQQQYDSMASRNVGYNGSEHDNKKRRSPMEEDEEHQQLMKSKPQDDGGGDDNEDLLLEIIQGTKKGKFHQEVSGTLDHHRLQQQHEHHGSRRSKMKHSKLKQEGGEEARSWRSEGEDGRHGGHKKKTAVTMKNKASSEEANLMITLKEKKQKKKMKLRDLDTVLHDGGEPVDEKYKCSTCNKSFSTHQALGGHRSSHNKLKHQHHHHRPEVPPLPTPELVTGEQVAAAAMEEEATGIGGVGKVLLGFDLNELPEEGSGMDLYEYWGTGVCENSNFLP